MTAQQRGILDRHTYTRTVHSKDIRSKVLCTWSAAYFIGDFIYVNTLLSRCRERDVVGGMSGAKGGGGWGGGRYARAHR